MSWRRLSAGSFLLLVIVSLLASAPAALWAAGPTWARHYGGSTTDRADWISKTSDGGYILLGHTASWGTGAFNLWILKLDGEGKVVWERVYPTDSPMQPTSIAQALNGDYVVSGYIQPVQGSSQAWAARLHPDGTIMWQKAYGSQFGPMALQRVIGVSDGGSIGTGYMHTYTVGAMVDVPWVIKWDGYGNVIWQRTYWAPYNSYGRDIQETTDGNYVVAAIGQFSADWGRDFWVLKVAPGGSVLWQKTYGGAGDESGAIIRKTADGGYILAGNAPNPAGGFPEAVAYKLTSTGQVTWGRSYWGQESLEFRAIEPLAAGGYIAAGYRDPTHQGNGSGWIVGLDGTGGVLWQRNYGGDEYACFHSMVLNEDGGATAAGDTLSYGSGGEAWVVRTDASGTLDPSCPFVTTTSEGYGYLTHQPADQQASAVSLETPIYNTAVVPTTLTPASVFICGTPPVVCTVTCDAVVPLTAVAGMTVQLTALAQAINCTGVLTYDWEFGDGGTSTDQNPFHVYASPGTYLLRVNASAGGFVCSWSSNIYVSAPQAPLGTTWARHYGTDAQTERNPGRMRKTADSRYIYACSTYPVGSTLREFWFLKTDFYGEITGQTIFPTAGDEEPCDLQPTSDGGAIVATYSDSFARAGGGDAWLLKLDAFENCEWQKAYGTGAYDKIRSIVPTADGGYIATGTIGNPLADDSDLWVLKLDPDGEVAWQYSYGGDQVDFGYSVRQTSDGGYIVAGETLSFGQGGQDLWILKLDGTGGITWQATYGGPQMEFRPVIREVFPGGGYFVAATTTSSGAGNYDGLFVKLRSDGYILAATTAGGFGWDEFHAMEVTPDGGAIIAGYTDLQAQGMGSGWLLRVDPAGDSSVPLLWQRAVGVTGYDDLFGVAVADDGGFTASGNTIEFGVDALALHVDQNGNMEADCPLWIPANEWQSSSLWGTATAVTPVQVGAAEADTQVQWSPYNALDPIICGPPCEVILSALVPKETSVGLSTQFTARLSTILCAEPGTSLWSFGDGSTSTEANPWHTYAAPGEYFWSLTAGAGTVTKTVQGTILVGAAAPVQGTTWAHRYGNTVTERSAGGTRTTADGGYLLGCYTYPVGSNLADGWNLNLNPSGEIVRQKIFTAQAWDDPEDLQPTPDGGAIVAGYTESYGQGKGDAWVIKLNADGTPAWQKTYGGPEYDKFYSIIPTPDGGYAAVGVTTPSAGNTDLWVIKLDTWGLITWQWTYGGSDKDHGTSIRQTSDGGYIVAGVTRSFGAGSDDIWLLKLTNLGAVTWNRTYGGSSMEFGPIVRVASTGNYLVSATKDSGGMRYDGLLICVDPSANFLWANTLASYGYDYIYNMEALPDGGAILAGYYDNRTMGSGEGWAVRVDAAGNLLWQRIMGGESYDSFFGVSVGPDGGFTLGGSTVSWGNGGDVWAVHLDPNGNLSPECELRVPAAIMEGVSLTIGQAAVTPMPPFAGANSISPPSADYTAADYVICAPGCTIACTATVPETGYVLSATWFIAEATLTGCTEPPTFHWDFGNGQSYDGQILAHGYLAAGTYQWTLTVTSGNSACVQRGTIVITESPCTIVCYVTVPETGYVSTPIAFVADPVLTGCTEPPAFEWHYGDGSTGDGQNTTHTYAAPGTYQWAVYVNADGFRCIKAGSIVIGQPVCSVECDATAPATGTEDTPLQFQLAYSATQCVDPVTISWDFGDGGTSAEQNPTHAYASPGIYAWSVWVASGNHTCVDRGVIEISAPPCELTCVVTVPATAKAGVPVLFQSVVYGPNCPRPPSYFWSFGDGTTSTDDYPHHIFAIPGQYDWYVIITAGNSSCQKTGTIHITAPKALFITPTGSGDCSQADPCTWPVANSFALDGDTVYASGGLYTGTGAEVCLVDKAITLQGGWDGTTAFPPVTDCDRYPSLFDGENQRRVFTIASTGDVALKCLTAQHGKAEYGAGIWSPKSNLTLLQANVLSNLAEAHGKDPYGGGLYFEAGELLVESCHFSGNHVYCSECVYPSGGGLYIRGALGVALKNSTVDHNDAWMGSGLYALDSSSSRALLTIRDSIVQDNGWIEGGYGGGIYLLRTNAALYQVQMIHNRAINEGAGIRAEDGTLVLSRCPILQNQGGQVAGLFALNAPGFNMSNCIVAENKPGAAGGAGGLWVSVLDYASLRHNTFARNHGDVGTPGIYVASGQVLMRNNIIAGETVGIAISPVAFANGLHTLWGAGAWANGTDFTGPGTFTTSFSGDPLFVDPTSSDYHIQAGSPAVDTGMDAEIVVDIDGEIRPMRAGFDIGADEVPACTLECTATVPLTGFAGSAIYIAAEAFPSHCAGEATYYWGFGDGTTANGDKGWHTWLLPGTYEWWVEVMVEGVMCLRTGTITITESPCTITCSASVPESGMAKTRIPFVGEAVQTGCSLHPDFLWSFGDGHYATTKYAEWAYEQPGTYHWTLSAFMDGFTCLKAGTIVISRSTALFITPTGTGDCSQANPCTWPVAIAGALGGDTIYASGGTYTGAGAEVCLVDKSITLQGGWDGTTSIPVVIDCDRYPSVFDGEGQRRVFKLDRGLDVTLQCLTATRGRDSSRGGAVWSLHSNLTLRQTNILNSGVGGDGVDAYGGGLAFSSGDLAVETSTFAGNSAACTNCQVSMGGGLYLGDAVSAEVRNTLIETNYAWMGAGLCADNTSPVALWPVRVEDSIIRENGWAIPGASPVAAGYGGGLYLSMVDAVVERSLIRHNRVIDRGGGLFFTNGMLSMEQNSILLNEGDRVAGLAVMDSSVFNFVNNIVGDNKPLGYPDRVGALEFLGQSAVLLHNTFARNWGADDSPGIVFYGGDITMKNNIVAGQYVGIHIPTPTTVVLNGQNTLWGDGAWANGTDWDGGGTVSFVGSIWGDPLFVSPPDSDYHIQVASPAVDTGIDAMVPVDIDNSPRPMRLGFDIGADEVPTCVLRCAASMPQTGYVLSATPFVAEAMPENCLGSPTFYWGFGDGYTADFQSGTHAYLAPGTYEWWVEVMMDGVMCMKTGTITITESPCTLECTATVPEIGTAMTPISFVGDAIFTGCTDNPAFLWTFGDGTTASGNTGTHTYLAGGTYEWTLQVSANGYTCIRAGTIVIQDTCTFTCTATVPTIGFVMSATPFAAEVVLSHCQGPATFYWIFGDGSTADFQGGTHAYLAPGTYEWSLEVMADGIMCLQTGKIVITESPCVIECSATVPMSGEVLVPVDFFGSGIITGCVETPIPIFDFGDGTSAVGNALSHTYLQPGNYNWSFTLSADGFTCIKAGTITITGQPCSITCTATAFPPLGPLPLSVTFTGGVTHTSCPGRVSYAWDFGDGAKGRGPVADHTYGRVGSYSWKLTVTVSGQTCVKEGRIIVFKGRLPGDCNGDLKVLIGELQRGINMFLGIAPPDCGADCDGDGKVKIGELQKVINAFLALPSSC